MPENKGRFWRSETGGESKGREHASSGPGCDGKKINVSVLSAESAFKTRESLLTQHEAVRNLPAIPRCFVQAAEQRTEP